MNPKDIHAALLRTCWLGTTAPMQDDVDWSSHAEIHARGTGFVIAWPSETSSCRMPDDLFKSKTKETTPVAPPSDRKRKLQEFRRLSDALVADGMPVLSLEQINAEVAELRGSNEGAD